MVSANGRVFHVMDEGRTESIQLPSKYTLTARDAFNGAVLWKKQLPRWFNDLYPLKSGPSYMPRRLVAVEDTVYVSPGAGEKLLALNAATGEVRHRYEETATTIGFVCSNGTLFASVDPDRTWVDYSQQSPNCWNERDRARKKWSWTEQNTQRLTAIDTDTGRVLWQKKHPVAPLTLAADKRMVCLFNGKSMVALNRKSGEKIWTSKTLQKMPRVTTGYSPRLIIQKNYVLFAPRRKIFALNADTGEIVWSAGGRSPSGHYSPEDIFAVNGTVWTGVGGVCNRYWGYGLESGKRNRDWKNEVDAFYIRQRCYPGRATEQYLLPPVMGATFVDLDTGEWQINHWVRGERIYGQMPANGLVYYPPYACACYYQSKLNGFSALAAESCPHRRADSPPPEPWTRCGKCGNPRDGCRVLVANVPPRQQPQQLREDGCVAEAGRGVACSLGGHLSQSTAAYGKLFVSATDSHTVHALDQRSGEKEWSFTADGRVNSPPTLHNGRAIFGSADGRIYALRARDGAVCWTFRAALNNTQVMAFGQPASAWPLDGSALVQDGRVYAVAGRSMFLDGGLRLIILDAESGKLIAENVMDRSVPGTDKTLQDLMMGKHMPVALPDILSSDGKYVYMKSQTFNMNGERVRIRHQRPDTQYGKEVRTSSHPSVSWTHHGSTGSTGSTAAPPERAGPSSSFRPSACPTAASCASTRTTPIPTVEARSCCAIRPSTNIGFTAPTRNRSGGWASTGWRATTGRKASSAPTTVWPAKPSTGSSWTACPGRR